ncbi:MAG: low temperature requirement protein A [Fimbriimonadaceae bacterium]|jgi:low temperature requirement protein LtrA|nr:low temperature requirement protein A [Fimbriimonadaceae bacterium]
MKFRPGLVVPPSLQSGGTNERKVTWLELFFDLIFVVAVGQAALFLYGSYGWVGFGQFVVILVAIWWAWIGQTFYLTRFDSDDMVHKVLTVTQMFAVAALALNVQGAMGAQAGGFALAYVAIRAILVFEYVRAHRAMPETQALTGVYIAGFSLAALIWLASVWQPSPGRFWLWGTAIVIDFVTPFLAGGANFKAPPRIHHLPERFGLFTIVVLGESIIAVVLGLQSVKLDSHDWLVAILGWIIAFGAWWSYFEGIRGAEARAIVDRSSGRSFRVWMYSHLPLVLGIVGMAIGVKSAIKLDATQAFKGDSGVIFLLCSFVSMITMTVIYRTVPTGTCTQAVIRFVRAHQVVALMPLVGLPLAKALPAWILVLWVALLWITQVMLGLREETAGNKAEKEPGASFDIEDFAESRRDKGAS